MPVSESPPESTRHIAIAILNEIAHARGEGLRMASLTVDESARDEFAAFVDACADGRDIGLPQDLFGRLFAVVPTNPGEGRQTELLGTLELCRTVRKAVTRALWDRGKASPEALERVNDSVDRAMIDATSEIARRHNEALAGLEEEMDLREKFLAALSHDLRNPVAAAKMTADFLLGVDDVDRPNQRRLLGRISKGMDRVESMIRNLLDALRIKNRQPLPLALQECDISDLLRETVQGLEAVYGNRFELHDGACIEGVWDVEAVRRVIENLCVNAVKYGSRDGPVRIVALEIEGWVEVHVHNHGAPIPPSRIPSLFKLYVRPGRARSAGAVEQTGWGVGLYLVRSFVEAHGGHVRVSSTLCDGTTFSVRLPKWSRPEAGGEEKEGLTH